MTTEMAGTLILYEVFFLKPEYRCGLDSALLLFLKGTQNPPRLSHLLDAL
jgi:hypothetical protein